MLQDQKTNIQEYQHPFDKQPTFITEGNHQDPYYQAQIIQPQFKAVQIHQQVDEKNDTKTYSSKLNNQVIDKIYNQIQNSKVTISQNNKQAYISLKIKGQPKSRYQSIDHQRHQILRKKDKIMQQLKHIQLMEHDLNIKNLEQAKLKKKEKIQPMLNNQLVKTLKKQRKRHEILIHHKIEECQERQHDGKVVDFQMEKKMKDERRRKRKEKAEKSLEKMKRRKLQLKQNLQKSKVFYTKIKEKQPHYTKTEDIDREMKEQFQQNFKKALLQMKIQRNINLYGLKQHETEYLKMKQNHQKQKIQKLTKSQMNLSTSTPKYTSVFMQNVMKQQKQKQQTKTNKWNDIINNIQKNYIYSEHVRKQAKKMLKTKPVSPIKQQPHRQYHFDKAKMLQKGNEYLKQVRSAINLKLISNHTQKQPNYVEQKPKSHVKYINYLKLQPLRRREISSTQKMRKCLKEGNIDLFLKAADSSTQQSLYKSMKLKLQLLNQMQTQFQS